MCSIFFGESGGIFAGYFNEIHFYDSRKRKEKEFLKYLKIVEGNIKWHFLATKKLILNILFYASEKTLKYFLRYFLGCREEQRHWYN